MNGSVGWYRRDFTLPVSAFARYVPARFRSWIINFQSVNYTATVWLNGYEIGTHTGAYLPFEFSLKHVHAGVNRLIVRVSDIRGPADLPQGPSGGWWNFGGINQEVYLRSVQRADMSVVQVRPILDVRHVRGDDRGTGDGHQPDLEPADRPLRGTYGRRTAELRQPHDPRRTAPGSRSAQHPVERARTCGRRMTRTCTRRR